MRLGPDVLGCAFAVIWVSYVIELNTHSQAGTQVIKTPFRLPRNEETHGNNLEDLSLLFVRETASMIPSVLGGFVLDPGLERVRHSISTARV